MDNLTAHPQERAFDADLHEMAFNAGEDESVVPSPKLLIPCAAMFVALLALLVSRSLNARQSTADVAGATVEQRLETVEPPATPTVSATSSKEDEPKSSSRTAIAANEREKHQSDSVTESRTVEKAPPKPRIVRPGMMSLEQELALRREREARGEHRRTTHQTASPPREVAAHQASRDSEPSAKRAAEARSDAGVGAVTLAHWNRMNDVIDQEAAMRQAPSGGITAANAGDFLSRRIEAGQFAAGELRSLPTEQVDPAVLRLNAKLAAWYERGAQISSTGRRLLAGSESARRGPEGKAWQAADKSHQGEVQSLNLEAAQIQRAMQSKYRLAFPALR